MDEVKEVVQNQGDTFNAGPTASFGATAKIEPCSANECGNGHRWSPQMALAQCPGCGSQILMLRMIQCPICNQPTVKTYYRSDHTVQGFGIAALCRGQKTLAESTRIEMTRNHSQQCMDNWDETTGRMEVK